MSTATAPAPQDWGAWLSSQFRHALRNHYDYRFWVRTWVFVAVDFGLLIGSTVVSVVTPWPYVFLVLACVCFSVTIVLLVPETLASLRARKRLESEFAPRRELTLPEVRELMDKYPKYTFRLDRTKVWETQHNCSIDTFTCEELALAMKRPRSSFACISLQFLSDWLSFFASLMVFSSSTTTALSVVQGVLAVVDLSVILNETLALYLSKYRARIQCCWLVLGCYYWISLLVLYALFFSGFAICLVVADTLVINSTTGYVGGVPVENAPGFWTGWVLTFLVFATAVHLAITYAVFAACGCASYLDRRSGVEEFAGVAGKFYKGTVEEGMTVALGSLGRGGRGPQ